MSTGMGANRQKLRSLRVRREDLIALLALLPYLEGRLTNRLFFRYLSSTALFKPILGWMIPLTLLFAAVVMLNRKRLVKRFYNGRLVLVVLLSLISICFSDDKVAAVSTWLWFGIPIILALLVLRYCRIMRMDFSRILTGMLFWYTVFAVVTVVYSVVVDGLFLDSTVRMNARAGGPVIFGYTAAVYFAVCLCENRYMSKMKYSIVLALLTVAALGTGSRGAVWPILMLWVMKYLCSKFTYKKLLISIPLLILLAFLSTVDILSVITALASSPSTAFTRLFKTNSILRTDTLISSIDLLAGSSWFTLLFGRGIGGFFPYQKWLFNGGNMAGNVFRYNGSSFLVQPHNSFVYIAIECGIIALFVFVDIFIVSCRRYLQHKEPEYYFQILFVVTVVIVNCLDSVFFVQPGVAMVYWLLLLMMYEQHVSVIRSKVNDKPE